MNYEPTGAVLHYRLVIDNKPFWLRHSWSSKRIDQLRHRAVRSLGLVSRNRYYKGWSKKLKT